MQSEVVIVYLTMILSFVLGLIPILISERVRLGAARHNLTKLENESDSINFDKRCYETYTQVSHIDYMLAISVLVAPILVLSLNEIWVKPSLSLLGMEYGFSFWFWSVAPIMMLSLLFILRNRQTRKIMH